MDKTLRKNILLGFFVLIGMGLFIAAIFLVGSKSELFSKTFPLTAKFNNATGLKAGNNVRYNGVKVGIVKAVNLVNDTTVQVDMQIQESKRGFILTTAVATVASDGLMGDKLVNIAPGKSGGTQVHNGDILLASNPLNTDKILQTLSQSNDNIRVITENLKTLTTDINSNNGPIQMLYKDGEVAKSLKQSFGNLGAITNKVLDVSSSLQNITAQIQHGNGALGEIINDTSLAHNLAYTMSRLKETSDALNTASGKLSETIDHANNGNGTLNMLLTDTAFSASLRQSMGNIRSASKGLDEDMEALKHNFLTRGYFRKQAKKSKKTSKRNGE